MSLLVIWHVWSLLVLMGVHTYTRGRTGMHEWMQISKAPFIIFNLKILKFNLIPQPCIFVHDRHIVVPNAEKISKPQIVVHASPHIRPLAKSKFKDKMYKCASFHAQAYALINFYYPATYTYDSSSSDHMQHPMNFDHSCSSSCNYFYAIVTWNATNYTMLQIFFLIK